ncbi:DUF2617 family protein [Myxococcota bacterium]|nr:DUF2617 family protein [Myxococcota bacterium]
MTWGSNGFDFQRRLYYLSPMDFAYHFHLSTQLRETLFIPSNEPLEQVLSGITIIRKGRWETDRFRVDAYVLANSHAVSIARGKFRLAQVIACTPFESITPVTTLLSRELENPLPVAPGMVIGEFLVTTQVERLSLEEGVVFFEALPASFQLRQLFPGQGSPVTLLKLHEEPGGDDREPRLLVHSLHTYPPEEISIYSLLRLAPS